MVDVGGKANTERVARAQARVFMNAETLAMIDDGSHKKGDVLSVAESPEYRLPSSAVISYHCVIRSC